MRRINHVAHAHRPQQRRTPIRTIPYALMVLDHADGSGGDFHFLLKACVPNQKAMIEDRINISSSLNTFSIAIANGMPVV